MRQLTEEERKELERSPWNQSINFDTFSAIQFPRIDINNSTLTGTATSSHNFGKGNLVNCILTDFNTINVDLEYVDLKDCDIRDSRFTKTSFDYGAIINNVFSNCQFEGSHFLNMSVTSSHFHGVHFINCDLSNIVIKDCRFTRCVFSNCITSNKLIESSLLFDCRFDRTDIQLETITDNFGLTISHLQGSNIRSNRLAQTHKLIKPQDMRRLAESTSSVFAALKLQFFLDEEIFLRGHDSIDTLFAINNWLPLCKIPSTFATYLESLIEFVFFEYERNNIQISVLLKLHHFTGVLIETVNLNLQLYKTVMGAHMVLSRVTEAYLSILYAMLQQVRKPHLNLMVNGPLDISYYEHELKHFLTFPGVKIVNVRIANSPNILELVWTNLDAIVSVVGVLLATRVKIEISKIEHSLNLNSKSFNESEPNLLGKNSEISDAITTQPDSNSLFSFEFGLGGEEEKRMYNLKLRSIFPKNLVADLRLSINTSALGKLRNILYEIISDKDNKDNH